MSELLTTQEVAERLGVHRNKVYELVNSGVKRNGRFVKLLASNFGSDSRATWKFHPRDVQKFLDETRNVVPSPEPVRPSRLPVPAKQYLHW